MAAGLTVAKVDRLGDLRQPVGKGLCENEDNKTTGSASYLIQNVLNSSVEISHTVRSYIASMRKYCVVWVFTGRCDDSEPLNPAEGFERLPSALLR